MTTPTKLPMSNFLRPTRSTRKRPTTVNMKLPKAGMVANQIALFSENPAISIMDAL